MMKHSNLTTAKIKLGMISFTSKQKRINGYGQSVDSCSYLHCFAFLSTWVAHDYALVISIYLATFRDNARRGNCNAGRSGKRMIHLNPASNASVFGPVASGKTNLMREWLTRENRYVRFDYVGDTWREADTTVEHINSLPKFVDRLEKNPYYFKIAYHPGKQVMEHYLWVQRALWILNTPRWLAVDEYHKICPQTPLLDEDVEYSLRFARHNQLGIIGMSQRPQDVHKLFVSSCRLCVVFMSQEENYLNACAGHWGSDVADAVSQLRPLIYDDTTGVVQQKQQCVVITRDGRPATVYDFATDSFTPIAVFLANPPTQTQPEERSKEIEDNRDMEQTGSSSASIPKGQGNTGDPATSI